MGHCNVYCWGFCEQSYSIAVIFKANSVAYNNMKRHRPWIRYHAPTTFENVKKVTRLYLHASVSGYTCM